MLKLHYNILIRNHFSCILQKSLFKLLTEILLSLITSSVNQGDQFISCFILFLKTNKGDMNYLPSVYS